MVQYSYRHVTSYLKQGNRGEKNTTVMATKKTTKQKQVEQERKRFSRYERLQASLGAVPNIDALLKIRTNGAVNIRGIRFQILYSVSRAFALIGKDAVISQITLEGIEDVDLKGIRTDDEFVQVKTADAPWKWSQLKDPLQGFLQVARADQICKFTLAVNFPLEKDLGRLASYSELPAPEQREMYGKFVKLCGEIGADESEAVDLMQRLSVKQVTESDLLAQVTDAVMHHYEIMSDAANIYLRMLVAEFLDWARERRTVTAVDLLGVRTKVGEALAREPVFEAVGRSLVTLVCWEEDQSPQDFLDGKGTRPGHIALDLDVPRPVWIQRIDEAVTKTGVCIVRSSSGQGKSTLIYRYAREHWPADNTFVLRAAQTVEQVAQISDYLHFRCSLGIPPLLLVNDADWHTSLWADVIRECAALGIRVLVAIRQEDWHRTALLSLTQYEIVEPSLGANEAKAIFTHLSTHGRIHENVCSAEWAYECIGEPRLLMEFVYLITQGYMLRDRLQDQIRAFRRLNEDPKKRELLRLASVAATLGAPVDIQAILGIVHIHDDPQDVLQSINGEYVRIDNGAVLPLHWVRSDHLLRILHDDTTTVTSSIIKVHGAVQIEHLSIFIENALCRDDVSIDDLLTFFASQASCCDSEHILVMLDAIYHAGERLFYTRNVERFAEAGDIAGISGRQLLAMDLYPMGSTNFLKHMSELDGEKWVVFSRLNDIVASVDYSMRGVTLCHIFLGQCVVSERALQKKPGHTGKILDWAYLCKIKLPAWDQASVVFRGTEWLCKGMAVDEFCDYTLGLYRYDISTYNAWYDSGKLEIIAYLRRATRTAFLTEADGIISVKFIVEDNDGSPLEQTMRRLDQMRMALPFAKEYHAQGAWLLATGNNPSVDDTTKRIPEGSLPFKRDAERNRIWLDIAEDTNRADSYYLYTDRLYRMRVEALATIKSLVSIMRDSVEGSRSRLSVQQSASASFKRWKAYADTLAKPPRQTDLMTTKAMESMVNSWATSLGNTLHFIFHPGEEDKPFGQKHLILHNLRDAIIHLRETHLAYNELFLRIPDYFGSQLLNQQELVEYSLLADLLDVLFNGEPNTLRQSAMSLVRRMRTDRQKKLADKLHSITEQARAQGVEIITPTDTHIEHPLSYLPVAYEVNNPCDLYGPLDVIFPLLLHVCDFAHFVYLIPTYRGARIVTGAMCPPLDQIGKYVNGEGIEYWETFYFLPELPSGVLDLLPAMPYQQPAYLAYCIRVSALFVNLLRLKELVAFVEPLACSDQCADHELYDEYMLKFSNAAQSLGIEAKNYLIEIPKELPSVASHEHYGAISEMLTFVSDATNAGVLLTYIPGMDIEQLPQIVEIIFRKSWQSKDIVEE